jgi:hypothetical protein
MGNKNGGKDARAIKAAGKPAFVAKMLSGQPRMHGTEGEFGMARASGALQQLGERPAMDGNRRP